MKGKLVALVISAILMALFGGCGYRKDQTPEYFMNQQRDPLLIGKWRPFNTDTQEFYSDHTIEYRANGEMVIHHHNGKEEVTYFYTKGNVIYHLSMGDGFKIRTGVWSERYRFEEHNTFLYTGSTVSDEFERYPYKRL